MANNNDPIPSSSNSSNSTLISLNLLRDGGTIADKDEINSIMNSRRSKIKCIIEKETFAIKEEELNILRDEILVEKFKLLIEKQNWRRENELERISKEDSIREMEDERRRIEDIRRKMEDERRRKEDERRRKEDERRRKEDERRMKEKESALEEDNERKKMEELYQVHDIRKQSYHNKKELLNRIQNEEKRIQYIENELIKKNILIREVYEQLENIVSKYSNLQDHQIIDLIIDELKSPSSDFYISDKQNKIEDDFIVVEESNKPIKKQDTLYFTHNNESKILSGFDYDIDYDVDWVFMDNSADDDDQFSLEKIFSFFKSKKNILNKAQEEGVTMSHTSVFLKSRDKYKAIREDSIIYHKNKMLEGLSSLKDKPSFIQSLSLPKIVLSNRDTWDSCSICENYFERLSIKMNCELCKNITCKTCGIHSTSFNIELINSKESKIVEMKLCQRCIDIISHTKNEIINQINSKNEVRGKKYIEISNHKKIVTDCILKISNLDTSDIEGMRPLVKKYMKSIHEIQSIVKNIKSKISDNELKIKQGDSSLLNMTEHKFQKLLVASTLTFLIEHKKYMNSFQKILQT